VNTAKLPQQEGAPPADPFRSERNLAAFGLWRLTGPYADGGSQENPLAATAMALLLAQYGDRGGLDMIFDHWVAARSDEVPLALLVGLALTKDAKFLPALRKRLDKAEDESDLRQALTYLRGVTGDEARRLRKDINERLRTGASRGE